MQMNFYLIKITLNKYALFFNVALCQKLSPTTLDSLPKNLLQWLYDPLLYGYSTICLIPPLLDMWLVPDFSKVETMLQLTSLCINLQF